MREGDRFANGCKKSITQSDEQTICPLQTPFDTSPKRKRGRIPPFAVPRLRFGLVLLLTESCKTRTDMTQKTILIADDDEDLVQALSVRCELMGLNVITADDATEALNVCDLQDPDLVCLDINMPGGNGLAACEMLTTDEYRREVPVIILTGRFDEDTIRRCHSLSAYYVAKSDDVWARVEPLICELLDIAPMEDRAARKSLTSTWASTCERALDLPTV